MLRPHSSLVSARAKCEISGKNGAGVVLLPFTRYYFIVVSCEPSRVWAVIKFSLNINYTSGRNFFAGRILDEVKAGEKSV